MITSLLCVTVALLSGGTTTSVGQWPSLRMPGLLGAPQSSGNTAENQPAATKKPTPAVTPATTPPPGKGDKPVGEGSFDDFGFGPETSTKPVAPATGAGTAAAGGTKPDGKGAPVIGPKPTPPPAPKPIGPVRLTARAEPLPKLVAIVAAPVAAAPAASAAKAEITKAGAAAAPSPSDSGFVKGAPVRPKPAK